MSVVELMGCGCVCGLVVCCVVFAWFGVQGLWGWGMIDGSVNLRAKFSKSFLGGVRGLLVWSLLERQWTSSKRGCGSSLVLVYTR